MAQKSGFFNALLDAGMYDRKYNADDYSDNLAVVIANGVLRSINDDLKVTAQGLTLTVNVGRAWINGHYFNNTTEYTLPAVETPTGGSRIDRVVLRLDKTIQGRKISIEYLEGTAATTPVAPELTRTDTIYEICLAEINVAAQAVTVAVFDKRADAELCGWVYSTSGDNSFFTSLDNSFNEWFETVRDTLASVTLFKRYKWETTIATETTTVTFNIPQYDVDTCFLEVYVNGLLSTDYSVAGSTLTFINALNAGAEVTVYCFKSIDGTGIMSVADEITELQNEVATLTGASHYVYKATGEDDNLSLTQISQAIYTAEYDAEEITEAARDFLEALGGLTWLQSLEADAQITIEVVGHLGVSTPAYGSGASSNRYRYFNFGQTSHSDMRVMFDFAKADTIYIDADDNTSNIIFYGTDLFIKNASVFVVNIGGGCNVQAIAGSNAGIIDVEGCRFVIHTTGDAFVGANGTYTNCEAEIQTSGGNSYCFNVTTNYLARVIGGRFLAYAKASGKTAAVFNIVSGQTNAVIMAQNVNCPTISVEGGYWQSYLAAGGAGKLIIDGVISTMNSTGTNTINNQVWQSKAY